MPNKNTEGTAPAKPRQKPKLDPEIVKLRKKHAEEVAAYLRVRSSANLLKTIVDKRLPRLVEADREKLLDVLMANTTRCFPGMSKPELEPEAKA
jgi:hypothetical protein